MKILSAELIKQLDNGLFMSSASMLLLIQVTDSTVLHATCLPKTYLKFLHITLHVSTNTGYHQAFKIVDENCCASVL
jgi:hypothetical protein